MRVKWPEYEISFFRKSYGQTRSRVAIENIATVGPESQDQALMV